MNDLRHYAGELEQMQSLPLEIKIRMTKMRIQQWVYAFSGEAYISFSGGKDSTVLLNIAREVFPNLPAVFCDTGLEYPEIREFVKRFENVVWLKPQMNFRQVIQKYGYPLISKSVANTLRGGHEPGSYRWKKLHGEVFLKNGKPSKFNCVKWQFLLDAPFKVSEQCCDVMKKRPFHKYQKETGQMPIVATMADESMMRKNSWMKYGCNAFDRASGPQSRPMSFWTERDVLEYLIKYDVPYASVYGDIIGLMPDGTIIPIVNDKDLSQQAKEYFAQIRKTDRLIHRLDSTIATLRSSLTSTGSQLKQDKVQTSGPKNTLEETITKIIDLEAKINARIDELVSMKQEAFTMINRIPDLDQQNILIGRYAEEVMKYLTSVMRGEHTEEIPILCGDGCQELTQKEVGAKERLKAAELIGKRYGMFTDKVGVEGAVPVIITGDDQLED